MSQNTARTNGLRVARDFDHRTSIINPHWKNHSRLIQTTTALEALAVMLMELEDQQIRADYVVCLIEPHIERLKEVGNELDKHLPDLRHADGATTSGEVA